MAMCFMKTQVVPLSTRLPNPGDMLLKVCQHFLGSALVLDVQVSQNAKLSVFHKRCWPETFYCETKLHELAEWDNESSFEAVDSQLDSRSGLTKDFR